MNLEEAKKIVFQKKHVFGKLYKEYDQKNWLSYINDKFPKEVFLRSEKKEELFSSIRKTTDHLLGEDITLKILETLSATGFVSSTDHQGVLSHPFFSNFSILRGDEKVRKENEAIVTFTCGCVSLTNSSYPRGFFLHDNDLNTIKFPLVSLLGRRRSVYGHEPFKKEKIISLIDKAKISLLQENQKEKLVGFLKKILKEEKLFSISLFSEQLLVINQMLWKEVFGEKRGELIYLETESIVRHLLLDFHIGKDTLFSKIIFDNSIRDSFIRHFEKVSCCHLTEEQKGSHLFWYIDKKENCRKQLFLKDGKLETTDGEIKIPLKPEILREHLEKFELLPNTALCYILLSFYYGLTLGGGFSQIQYLEDMKNSYENLLLEAGLTEKTFPPTDIFTGEIVLFGLSKDGKTVPATLMDFLVYGKDNFEEDISRAIEKVYVGESLDAMMEEFAEIITGKREAIDNLPTLHKTLLI